MMKNSKLSKLLVAGVSVAMLTSAFAPMAFAEEGSNTSIAGPTKTLDACIRVVDGTNVATPSTDYTLNEKYTVAGSGIATFDNNKSYSDYINLGTSEFGTKLDENGNVVADPTKPVWTKTIASDIIKTSRWTELDKWEIVDTLNSDSMVELDKSDVLSGSDISGVYSATGDSVNAYFTFTLKDKPFAILGELTGGEVTTAADKWTGKTVATVNGDAELYTVCDGVNKVLLTDTVKLPKFTMKDGYDMYYEVVVTWNATPKDGTSSGDQKDKIKVANGGSFDLSKYAKYFDTDNYSDRAVSVAITEKLVSPKAIQVTVGTAPAVYVMDEDGKAELAANFTDTTINAAQLALVDTEDVFDWAALTNANGVQINYGKTFEMPAVKAVKADNKDIATLVFDHWEVADDEGDLLADGKPAKGFVIENGVVVPEKFMASTNAGNTNIKLIPVFKNTAPNPVDSYTYVTTTPNDKVKVYDEKGKYKETITYDEYLQKITGDDDAKFEGGSFYNSKLGQWFYYSDEKVAKPGEAAKWVIDTTVTGVADGIYFTDGVQDTKAYGLKKVVGDDSAFVYLVSDGVYQADYNGMWEDEDGSVYKLEKGCTNTTFTGVYDRGDWALSVKDSKVQKDETGFVLYGDTQYWFINGICNMKETEAVRQHTNGHFYYTVGAKIDFTFNGTVNGHTFVNGEAAE